MATERTARELRARQAQRERVMPAIEQAINDLASWKVTETADLDPATCERWVNAVWNGLRKLKAEDRLAAIVALIEDTAAARARSLMRDVDARSIR